jgi:hypothetical protein
LAPHRNEKAGANVTPCSTADGNAGFIADGRYIVSRRQFGNVAKLRPQRRAGGRRRPCEQAYKAATALISIRNSSRTSRSMTSSVLVG